MGGGPSKADKAELERLERERDAKKAANDQEIASLKSAHQRQAGIMRAEIENRNSDLQKLRDEQINSARNNEEELRQKREEQEKRLGELREKQDRELAEQKNATEAEKRRVTEKYDKQAVEMKKAHDEAMRKAQEQKDLERQRRDEQIAAAEQERKELMAQQREAEKSYKKELDAKYAKHREEINEHWDKLAEQMEKHTHDALKRIAETTESSMAIVNENYIRVRKDAIESIHNNIFKEYIALGARVRKMEGVGTEMVEMIEMGEDEVPYEMNSLNGEHNTELKLVEKQMRELKNRMRTSFDVSEDFKNLLMSPLEELEESCSKVNPLSLKVIMAFQRDDPKMLGPVKERLNEHLSVTRNTLKAIELLDLKTEIERAIGDVAQRQITRD